ncbi:hypothetical protein GCK32_006286 [Trichostrongylus colubriformis]|uniref:SXP/RAL-2 family protein Ani s 5-like cation-binding domain-containing protein n=1 Tax=Trichostrongylus colubriformis TaxID=6319 RepID=A0AAN8ET90_TRICO
MKTFIVVLAIAGVVFCHPGGKKEKGESGEIGGPGRHHGPPPPPFLRNVTKEARKEFFAIVSNKDEKISQQKQEILTWAQKYGVEAQVQEFNVNMTKLKEEVKKNVTELISALPAALEQLSAIVENDDQSRTEMKEAIKVLTAGDPKVYRVLMFALREFRPRPAGPPRGPKFPGSGSMEDFEPPQFDDFPGLSFTKLKRTWNWQRRRLPRKEWKRILNMKRCQCHHNISTDYLEISNHALAKQRSLEFEIALNGSACLAPVAVMQNVENITNYAVMKTAAFVFALVGAILCHAGDNEGLEGAQAGLGGFSLPAYLRSVPEKARMEHLAIVLNMNDTIAKQKLKILAWAQKYGVEPQVQQFNTNLTSTVKKLKQNMTELISSLPSALQQYSSLIENENQTPLELKKAIETLAVQNPKVFSLVMFALGGQQQRPPGNNVTFEAITDIAEILTGSGLAGRLENFITKIGASDVNSDPSQLKSISQLKNSILRYFQN